MNKTNTMSRRQLLNASMGAAAFAGLGVLAPRSAPAEVTTDNFSDVKPALDLGLGGKVTQITMVVNDVHKVARRFSDIFGPSWAFYEFRPRLQLLHDQPPADAECVLKLAIGYCGGQSFKLVQPVSGQSSYAEFLHAQGEGFYGISVGTVANHDTTVEALRNAGARIEMQGDGGDGMNFTILDTVGDLGLRIEFSGLGTKVLPSALKAAGVYVPRQASVVDMSNPVLEGGKKFVQLGIVVSDGHHGARRFAELFGVRAWRYQSLPASHYTMFGKEFTEAELPSTTCEQCVAYLGDTQIELLVPVPQLPGGIHRRFHDRHGNGFQHLMLLPRTPSDHDATLEALWRQGMTKEIEYRLGINNFPGYGHYTGMEQQLGGFVLEY
jgi:Glyoxalase/Bleomycin resistance protein/Dioxygenase superfamily